MKYVLSKSKTSVKARSLKVQFCVSFLPSFVSVANVKQEKNRINFSNKFITDIYEMHDSDDDDDVTYGLDVKKQQQTQLMKIGNTKTLI